MQGIEEVFVDGKTGGLVLSAQSEAGRVHHLDKVITASVDANFDYSEEAKKVLQGYDVSLLGLTIGENRPPGLPEFKDQIRFVLKNLVKDAKNGQNCTFRFLALGLNDSSCIDLTDYSKIDPREGNGLVLADLESFKQLDSILAKDISLPFIVILNVQHELDGKRTDGNLIIVTIDNFISI